MTCYISKSLWILLIFLVWYDFLGPNCVDTLNSHTIDVFVQNPPFITWYQSYQSIKNIKVGWSMYLFNIWEYRSQENVVLLTILQWESSYKGLHIAIFTALFYHHNIFDLSQSIHLNFWIKSCRNCSCANNSTSSSQTWSFLTMKSLS